MDLVQDGFASIFERNRARDDRDEETEAITSVVRRLAALTRIPWIGRHPGIAGRAVHYVFGCGFAAGYVALCKREPRLSAGNGLAFGVALWLLSDAVLIPVAHLGRPLLRYSWPERANALLSHLAYGITVEALATRSE